MAEPRQAVQCTGCGAKWFGRPGDACKVCVSNELARKGIYTEFKGVRKGPVQK